MLTKRVWCYLAILISVSCIPEVSLADERIIAAVTNNQPKELGKLLQDASIDGEFADDDVGNNLLHFAAITDSADVCPQLLQFGVDINGTNEYGVTPLIVASWHGGNSVVKWLLAHNAKVDFPDKGGMTPLHAAAFTGKKEIVRFLLKAGAEINAQDKKGKTPLLYSAGHHHIASFAYLLSEGAQTNITDLAGKTALDYLRARNLSTKVRHFCYLVKQPFPLVC